MLDSQTQNSGAPFHGPSQKENCIKIAHITAISLRKQQKGEIHRQNENIPDDYSLSNSSLKPCKRKRKKTKKKKPGRIANQFFHNRPIHQSNTVFKSQMSLISQMIHWIFTFCLLSSEEHK
jgi:hypothetical protein